MGALAYSTPLSVRFRGLTVREGLLLHGPAGWAEFSPFEEYDERVSLPWLRAALEAATVGYPAPRRDSVPVNVTVPAVEAAHAHRIVAGSGCRTAKVKVAEPGQNLDDEIARLEAVRDAIGPDGHVRVDANSGWSLEEALRALPVLDRAAGGLQYAEQPCARVEDLAALRRALDVPIAADESIRRAEDPFRVKALDAADVIVVKVQPLGGVRACLRLAEQMEMPIVVSSALESSVGIAAGVALGAALPEEPLASGLATVRLFDRDVTAAPLLPEVGALPVRPITPDALQPADEATSARWIRRARRVGELLDPTERETLAELLAS